MQNRTYKANRWYRNWGIHRTNQWIINSFMSIIQNSIYRNNKNLSLTKVNDLSSSTIKGILFKYYTLINIK